MNLECCVPGLRPSWCWPTPRSSRCLCRLRAAWRGRRRYPRTPGLSGFPSPPEMWIYQGTETSLDSIILQNDVGRWWSSNSSPTLLRTRGPPESPWQESLPPSANPAQMKASLKMVSRRLLESNHSWHFCWLITSTSTSCSLSGVLLWPCAVLPHPITVALSPTYLDAAGGRQTWDNRGSLLVLVRKVVRTLNKMQEFTS